MPGTQPRREIAGLLAMVAQRAAFGVLVLLSIIYLCTLGLDMAGGTRLGPAAVRAAARTMAYAGRLARGELGMTVAGSDTALPRPVGEVLRERLPRTLGLLGAALLAATLLGVPLGILAARGRGGRSLGILLITLAGVSVPSFFAAFALQWAAIASTQAAGRTLLPVAGFGWDARMLLPALVLAARPLAQITRMTFITVRHVLAQDYVRTARSKGLRRGRLMAVHVMRNAAIPILTTIALSLRFSLSSLPVVELYFGWTGVGFLLLKAIAQQDDNLTTALILCLGLLFIAVNVVLEVIYRLVDPRLRGGASQTVSGALAIGGGSDLLHAAGDALWGAWHAIRAWPVRLRRSLHSRSGPPREPSLAPRSTRDGGRPRFEVPAAAGAPAGRRHARRALLGNLPLLGGAALVVGLAVVVAAGPWLAPNDPARTQGLVMVDGAFTAPPFAPNDDYPWGSDALGRCIMSLILAGARQTLTLALLAVVARTAVGVVLGAAAGWTAGRTLDRLILAAAEIIAAFPTLLLAMTLILALGIRRGMPPFIVALCFVGWGEIMQFVRGRVIAIRPQPYIESAVAVGAHTPRILFRHILPHLLSELTSIVALEMGAVLMLLGELGFIHIFIGGGTLIAGTSGQPLLYSDVPEWGALLGNLRTLARSYPWTALYPMLAFALSILAFNLLGEGVRRLLEGGMFVYRRAVNRTTLALAVVAVLGLRWLNVHGGAMPFYRQQARAFDGGRAWEHIVALTHPAMQGRALGTPGMDLAAGYIADRFAELGLQAAGQEGTFFQERRRSFLRPAAQPVLELDLPGPALLYGRDYALFPTPYTSIGEARGPLRWIGLGQQMDIGGVVWRPVYPNLYGADFSGEILLALSAREAEVLNMVDREALLIVADDLAQLARQHTVGGRPRERTPPWIWISEDVTKRLLAAAAGGSQQAPTLGELREMQAGLGGEQVLELPLNARAHVHVEGTPEESWPVQNVIGYIPGAHSYDFCVDCLGKQLIVVMAPYDSPPPIPGVAASPAANDNASGVAVMLEAIRVLQETEYRPYKSMLFVAYSGEGLERGEYAYEPDVSRFLQARPGMSEFALEAVVQVRGVGGGTGRRVEIGSGGSLRLAELFDRAAARMGVNAVRAGTAVDVGLVYAGAARGAPTQDTPTVRLHWEGWEAYARTPGDTLAHVSSASMEKAGRTLALALMILGRETAY